jgi:hypothetical protein
MDNLRMFLVQSVSDCSRLGARQWCIFEHMPIRVECYAGYRGEQEPMAFWLGERRVAVRAIADRWYSPAQRWFRVEAEDGDTYILRDDGPDGQWELAAFTSAKSPGTG